MNKTIIIELLENKINNIENFSGVIKISKSKMTIYEKTYGFSDISNERLNNIDTSFGVASGAKLLTAISICKLVEDKKLKFESLLKDYIDFDNFDKDITIDNLLTHTSGIPDYFDETLMSDFSELWINKPMYMMKEPKDFLELIKSQKTMFKPGEKFFYNNGAFVILAYIVEKVSGKKFVDFVKENIFDVLEMDHSGYFSMDILPKNCAYGYIENNDGSFKTNIYSIPIIGGGDGGVFLNANDISKLWNGLLNYKLLDKDITSNLLTPKIHVNSDLYYGYGIWIVKRDDGIYKYYITGSDPGVTFESAIYPKEEVEITILGNTEFNSYELIREIEFYKDKIF